jgi:hypothetical protein
MGDWGFVGHLKSVKWYIKGENSFEEDIVVAMKASELT